MSLLMQQLLRALMEEEKPKQFGDLMSVEAPSMIPSHEEGGGYSPSYYGDDRKLYRNPTGVERLLLYPGQALESIKDVITRPSSSPNQIPSTSSWITEFLGKTPEAAWRVLNPLIDMGGEDVTQAYSKTSGEDQGRKLDAITSGVALASSLKGKGKGGRPPTRILDEYYMKGKGKDPHGRGKVGIQDNDYEPRITEIERMLSKLEPENLPQSRWKDNPQMTEDANNAVGKWRNMLEDLYTRALSNSEQVSAGVKPRDRLFTVPDGFDHEGNPAFKLLSDPEKIDSALAKTWFDIQRDMGRYFDFNPVPEVSDDVGLSRDELDLLQLDEGKQRDLRLLRGERSGHRNEVDDPVFGRNVVMYDDKGVARIIPGTSSGMIENDTNANFLNAIEPLTLTDQFERVNAAWDRYAGYTAPKMDNNRPQIASPVNRHNIPFRLTQKSEVEAYLNKAGDLVRTYLIDGLKNDLSVGEGGIYFHPEEIMESFVAVNKDLEKVGGMTDTPLTRAEKSVGDLVPYEVVHSLPALSRQMAGGRAGRIGTMIVDEILDRSRINGALASQMEELDDLTSPLTPEAKDGYKKSMETSVRQAIVEMLIPQIQFNMGLSRNYLIDELFSDILSIEEDRFRAFKLRQ